MLAPTLALVATAAVWGSTFVLVKEAVEEIPTLEFLALRFALGTVALAAVWPGAVGGLRRAGAKAVVLVGTALAAGYALQTFGLERTGATNAGFITGLFVVFTPVLSALILRRLPSAAALTGVVLATAGLAFLSLRVVGGRPALSAGDLLVLGCAVAFALHIVALGRFAPLVDVRVLSVGQVGLSALVFAALSPIQGWVMPMSGQVWLALAVTSLGATAFAFAAQTWAQARLSPTRTAVILTMEPVFAGLFGYLWLDERLSARGWLGAGLIVAGMLAAEARLDRRAGDG